MQKRWVQVTLAVAALLVIAIVLVPFLVNADTFRPMLQNQLSAALGRRITLGHISFSLLSGSLVAEDIVIADDPAFSSAPFLQARTLRIGIDVAPFLFHRQLNVRNLIIESPSIQLIHAQDGRWNFSSIGGTAQTSQKQPGAIPDFTVGELKISNGSATVSSMPSTGKTLAYTAVNLDLHQFAFNKSFPFQLSASLPGAGSFQLSGTGGPIAQQDASDTPFRATLQLKHFDPVAVGVVDRDKGISMVTDIDAQLASDGATLTSSGKIQASNLQLARTGSPAPRPVDIDYSISNNLDTRTGQVSDISIHTGNVAAHVNGSYQLTPQAVVLNLRLAAPNLPIDQLEQLLPAFGVTLPSGSDLRGGSLTANLAITGPATATTITGPVEIDNTQLAGFDLGSKIQGMNPFGGTGGGTAIQTLRANVNSSPQSTQLTNIYGNLPQIGSATGNGTVYPNGSLDFHLVAMFSATSGVGAIAGTAVNAVSSLLGGFLHPNAKPSASKNTGIPLTITGTTKNPSIHADLGAMLR